MKKLGIDQTTAWLFAVFLSLCLFAGIYFFLSSIAKDSSVSMMEYLDRKESRQESDKGAGNPADANSLEPEPSASPEDQEHEETQAPENHDAEGEDHGSIRHDPESDMTWSYSGRNGPENWGRLSDNFLDCRVGRQQSPIDLNSPVPDGTLEPLQFAYEETLSSLRNDGHTILGDYTPGSDLLAGDGVYHLREFHFHVPSEHTVDGIPYDMEMHLVHQSDEGKIAFLAVFLAEGARGHEGLRQLWPLMPLKAGEQSRKIRFNIEKLLPEKRRYFTYEGSLTSPPCGEGVRWYLLKEPIKVSSGQIDQFIRIFRHNSRPVQSIHKRTIRISSAAY